MPAPRSSATQLAPRLLAGADDDRVDVEQLRLAVDADVQTGVVDALVLDAGEHRDAALLEQRAADPAGRLGEAGADLARLALQQPHLRAAAAVVARLARRRARA